MLIFVRYRSCHRGPWMTRDARAWDQLESMPPTSAIFLVENEDTAKYRERRDDTVKKYSIIFRLQICTLLFMVSRGFILNVNEAPEHTIYILCLNL